VAKKGLVYKAYMHIYIATRLYWHTREKATTPHTPVPSSLISAVWTEHQDSPPHPPHEPNLSHPWYIKLMSSSVLEYRPRSARYAPHTHPFHFPCGSLSRFLLRCNAVRGNPKVWPIIVNCIAPTANLHLPLTNTPLPTHTHTLGQG
jgi:hypothetical protein